MQPMAKKSSGALVTVQTPGLFLRTQALRSAVKKPPAMSRGILYSEYLAYISQIGEPTSGLEPLTCSSYE